MWTLLILVLTLTPSSSLPSTSLFSYDKLGHIGVFTILSYLFVSGLNVNRPKQLSNNAYLAFFVTITYGIAIEIMQAFIPERGMEFFDMLANGLGSILGISMFYVSIKKKWQ